MIAMNMHPHTCKRTIGQKKRLFQNLFFCACLNYHMEAQHCHDLSYNHMSRFETLIQGDTRAQTSCVCPQKAGRSLLKDVAEAARLVVFRQ